MQWYEAATFYLDRGSFKKAIALCQQVLSQQPNLIQAYKILGKALQKQADFQAAIQCYSQALTIQPDDSEIYLELGNIYTQQQQWQDAILSYQTAIRLQPECLTAYRSLGQILTQLEQWEAAIKIYRKLIQLHPQVSWFYNHLGKALMRLKRWEEAINAYQASIKLNPKICWSYYHLGKCFIESNQLHKAEYILKEGIQIDSSHDIFYQKLGNVLQQQNKDSEAITIYQKAIHLNPCSAYYMSLGKLFKQQQQLEKAVDTLIQTLHLQPQNYDVFVILGEILKQQGFILESLQCKNLMKIPVFWIKQYFNLPHHYITKTDSDSNIQRNVIYPSSAIQFSPPQTLEGHVPTGFDIQQAHLKEVFVATLKNGRVWADSLTNTVITSNNKIVSDLSEGCPELILCSDHLLSPLQLEGTVAFLSVQFGLVYYHWMLDILPRIDLLRRHGLFESIDYFVVNRYKTAYEKATLKAMGVSQYQIIESVEFPHVKASSLIVPSRIRESVTPQRWAIECPRQYFLDDFSLHSSQRNRIYISRTQAKKRKIINEEAIIDILKQYGFQTVNFELMSIEEQANCMANAELVIAPHGSGLTNLVFCQPGTKVIEILSPNWLNSCYWMLSQTCQLDYFCLVAEPSSEDISTFNQYQDLYVNIKKLQKLMHLAEVI